MRDYSDCMKVTGENGEIGFCPSCNYYRNLNHDYYTDNIEYKKRIERDCKFLSNTIDLVRRGKGNPEDIGEALLRLKSSSYTYQQFYEEKLDHGQKGNLWEEKKQ